MRCAFLAIGALSFALPSPGAEPEYPRDVSQWREVLVPAASEQAARAVWEHAANDSKHEWRVFLDGDRICAQLTTEKPSTEQARPKFTPEAEQFHGASAFAAVDGGWLVGFNDGEFGAALYWFSGDGSRKYKVSNHQVIDFLWLSDGLYAIEGLAHLLDSKGSLIRIAQPRPAEQWHATDVTKLPSAPYAASTRKDGTAFITLSNAVVSFGKERKVNTVIEDAPWSILYPNSSVLSQDEQRLYVGLRQFVAEIDLKMKTLRLLIPSDEFLNKLPDEQEQQIRKVYGG